MGLRKADKYLMEEFTAAKQGTKNTMNITRALKYNAHPPRQTAGRKNRGNEGTALITSERGLSRELRRGKVLQSSNAAQDRRGKLYTKTPKGLPKLGVGGVYGSVSLHASGAREQISEM